MSPFEALFGPDELRRTVSGRAWLAAMLEAERALANAGSLAGAVPAHFAGEIAEACVPDRFDLDSLLEEGRAVGNPAEPLVRALVSAVRGEAAGWVHRGATSQEIVDTAAMLVSRNALRLVLAELDRATDAAAALARAHRSTPIVGRTLLRGMGGARRSPGLHGRCPARGRRLAGRPAGRRGQDVRQPRGGGRRAPLRAREPEIRAVLDPLGYLGSAEAFVDRALAAHEAGR